jgi:hypothetical protein
MANHKDVATLLVSSRQVTRKEYGRTREGLYQSVCPVVRIGSADPLSCKRVCPPPPPRHQRGGGLAGEGAGGADSDDQLERKPGTLYTLRKYRVPHSSTKGGGGGSALHLLRSCQKIGKIGRVQLAGTVKKETKVCHLKSL